MPFNTFKSLFTSSRIASTSSLSILSGFSSTAFLTSSSESSLSVFNPGFGFINVVTRDKQTVGLINISDQLEIGLSCGLRSILALEYKKMFPELIVFHACTIVDLRTQKAIVLASQGDIFGEKKGKTTMALAGVVDSEKRYAFLGNDDLFLAPDVNGELRYLPFPTEINVGYATRNKILSEGYHLPVEPISYGRGGSTIFMTTTGGLSSAGHVVATGFKGISNWVFLDLDPNRGDYKLEVIVGRKAEAKVLESVHMSRMIQLNRDIVYGELKGFGEVQLQTDQYQKTTNAMFQLLQNTGTTFYTLVGGMDRRFLREILESL